MPTWHMSATAAPTCCETVDPCVSSPTTTVVAELVRSGRLRPELAASHPERGVVTQAIGLGRVVLVEVPDPVSLAVGDQLLLCTDGLTGVVDDDQVTELLSTRAQPESACLALIDAANAAGGP